MENETDLKKTYHIYEIQFRSVGFRPDAFTQDETIHEVIALGSDAIVSDS